MDPLKQPQLKTANQRVSRPSVIGNLVVFGIVVFPGQFGCFGIGCLGLFAVGFLITPVVLVNSETCRFGAVP